MLRTYVVNFFNQAHCGGKSGANFYWNKAEEGSE